jgi:hypothetical protein
VVDAKPIRSGKASSARNGSSAVPVPLKLTVSEFSTTIDPPPVEGGTGGEGGSGIGTGSQSGGVTHERFTMSDPYRIG